MTGLVIGIDPGEVHNGVCVLGCRDGEWSLRDAAEYSVEGLFTYVEAVRPADTVALEEYRLYPWLLQQQGFSEVLTVETIGVVKYICRLRGTTVHKQPATIKKPTFAVMEYFGLGPTGKNQHIRDAEAHAWHYVLNELGWRPT